MHKNAFHVSYKLATISCVFIHSGQKPPNNLVYWFSSFICVYFNFILCFFFFFILYSYFIFYILLISLLGTCTATPVDELNKRAIHIVLKTNMRTKSRKIKNRIDLNEKWKYINAFCLRHQYIHIQSLSLSLSLPIDNKIRLIVICEPGFSIVWSFNTSIIYALYSCFVLSLWLCSL